MPTTRYRQVADTIRAQLDAGKYGPGSSLPARAALADEFRCSIVTVRTALRILEQEGRISVHRGAAALVQAPPTRADRFDAIHRLLAELARQFNALEVETDHGSLDPL